jgi:hypothetical protein
MEFSKINEKRYKWFFNLFSKTNKNITLENYFSKIGLFEDFILNLDLGMKSKEAFYFMISRKSLIENDMFNFEKFKKLGIEQIVKYDEIENNELDEKEKINFRDNKYFLKIIKNFNFEKEIVYEEHLKILLLMILVLTPPLRINFYKTCMIINSRKENDGINNFIVLEKDEIYYIVNNDKVSKHYLDEKYKKIVIENKELKDYLRFSILKFNRKYLFENLKTKKEFSNNSLLKFLREISNVELINFDIMRSSYISSFYLKYGRFKDREKLSFSMRHGIITAQKNYLKIFEEESIVKNNIIHKLNDIIEKKDLEDFDVVEKIENVNYKKKRNDIIYRINKKNVIPKPSTLILYKIKFNDETKIYF